MSIVDIAAGPVRVLVVEDSEDQRVLLRTYLEKAGCEVVAVQNAEDAIPAYLSGLPELAIIDLVLPGMDGWELVARLRKDQPGCAIAVTSVLETQKFPDAEAVLPKPFTGEQVRQALRDCVPRWSER